jgi:hypothetical protein
MNTQRRSNGLRGWIFRFNPAFFRARIVERFGQPTLSPTKSDNRVVLRVDDLPLKEWMMS